MQSTALASPWEWEGLWRWQYLLSAGFSYLVYSPPPPQSWFFFFFFFFFFSILLPQVTVEVKDGQWCGMVETDGTFFPVTRLEFPVEDDSTPDDVPSTPGGGGGAGFMVLMLNDHTCYIMIYYRGEGATPLYPPVSVFFLFTNHLEPESLRRWRRKWGKPRLCSPTLSLCHPCGSSLLILFWIYLLSLSLIIYYYYYYTQSKWTWPETSLFIT